MLEHQTQAIVIAAPAQARVFIDGAPAGSQFDESTRTLTVTPDFTQGGKNYPVTVNLFENGTHTVKTFTITIANNIQPPDPVVVSQEVLWQAKLYRVKLTTDSFLDPPGLAGRQLDANVIVPDAASVSNPLPMSVLLHGSGGLPTMGAGSGLQFGIGPSEPYVSWWTGQHENYPNPPTTNTRVPNTSQRRILHLIDWVTRTFPGVDRERVHMWGTSMGGTGAIFFATRYGYHLAQVSSSVGMTSIPLSQAGQQVAMEPYWGPKAMALKDDLGMNVWDRYDITRALRDDKWVRNIPIETDSGINDSIIKFHHVSVASPLTGKSWAQAAQDYKIGHRIFWDQREHTTNENSPLPAYWWGQLPTAASYLRNKPFPAFTRSAIDNTPPLFNASTGTYTGNDARGARNRFLAWNSAGIVDTHTRLEMPLFVRTQPAAVFIGAEYPTAGDGYTGALPVAADVTIRRAQKFIALPGETIHWSFGALSGTVSADQDGAITVPQLPIPGQTTPTTLVLQRTL